MIDTQALRAANIARKVEWPGTEQADLAFCAIELADEAGELCGAVKKLLRARRGIAGSKKSLEDVADEIGDTVISLDLLAIKLRLDVLRPSRLTAWADRPAEHIVLQIDWAVGQISDMAISCLWNKRDSPDAVRWNIAAGDLQALVEHLAEVMGIDAARAVGEKFNKTSAKYGLRTMIEISHAG